MTTQQWPGRVYYPLRRGVAVTARYLRVDNRMFAIRDLTGAGSRRGRRDRSWQLWANHQGTLTLLWVSGDGTEFHQVCRALQRAIEAFRDQKPY